MPTKKKLEGDPKMLVDRVMVRECLLELFSQPTPLLDSLIEQKLSQAMQRGVTCFVPLKFNFQELLEPEAADPSPSLHEHFDPEEADPPPAL